MAAVGGTAPLLCASFNQDGTCIATGGREGFSVFTVAPFARVYASPAGVAGHAKAAEMLFRSSLVAVVGSGAEAGFSPRTLRLVNTVTGSRICELNFTSTVLRVLLNDARLVVVLERRVHIFELDTMKQLHALDTAPNPSGVCALSPTSRRCYMALPASGRRGDVLVYDALNLTVVSSIDAHQAPLRALAFSRSGAALATCSERGTVVRAFSVPEGRLLSTLRRGVRPAAVFSLSFSASGRLLAVTSDSSTVHVFRLDEGAGVAAGTGPGAGGAREEDAAAGGGGVGADMTAEAASALAAFLPQSISDVVEPARSFAQVQMRDSMPPTYCAFAGASERRLAVVAASSGHLRTYTLPDSGGPGECVLEAEHALVQSQSEALGTRLHASADGSRGGGGGDGEEKEQL